MQYTLTLIDRNTGTIKETDGTPKAGCTKWVCPTSCHAYLQSPPFGGHIGNLTEDFTNQISIPSTEETILYTGTHIYVRTCTRTRTRTRTHTRTHTHTCTHTHTHTHTHIHTTLSSPATYIISATKVVWNAKTGHASRHLSTHSFIQNEKHDLHTRMREGQRYACTQCQ